MKCFEKNELVNAVVPIIAFVIYGLLYFILVGFLRFILFFNDSEILFYGLLLIANVIALVVSFFVLKIKAIDKSPFAKFLLSGALLIAFFLLNFFSQFIVTELLGSFDGYELDDYFLYLTAPRLVTICSFMFLLLIVGFVLNKKS